MWLMRVLPSVRMAQARRAAGAMDGTGQDEQSLIQVAAMELRCLTEGLGDKVVSVLEFIQS